MSADAGKLYVPPLLTGQLSINDPPSLRLYEEECSHAATHFYAILAVGRNTGKCTHNDWLHSEEMHKLNFENGQFKLGAYTSAAYDGHIYIERPYCSI